MTSNRALFLLSAVLLFSGCAETVNSVDTPTPRYRTTTVSVQTIHTRRTELRQTGVVVGVAGVVMERSSTQRPADLSDRRVGIQDFPAGETRWLKKGDTFVFWCENIEIDSRLTIGAEIKEGDGGGEIGPGTLRLEITCKDSRPPKKATFACRDGLRVAVETASRLPHNKVLCY